MRTAGLAAALKTERVCHLHNFEEKNEVLQIYENAHGIMRRYAEKKRLDLQVDWHKGLLQQSPLYCCAIDHPADHHKFCQHAGQHHGRTDRHPAYECFFYFQPDHQYL